MPEKRGLVAQSQPAKLRGSSLAATPDFGGCARRSSPCSCSGNTDSMIRTLGLARVKAKLTLANPIYNFTRLTGWSDTVYRIARAFGPGAPTKPYRRQACSSNRPAEDLIDQ